MSKQRPKRCTAEVVARIREIARANPDLGLRQIGYHFDPPISHSTIGKVLRGERGVTVRADGTMVNHAGGRPRVTRPPKDHKKILARLRTLARADVPDDPGSRRTPATFPMSEDVLEMLVDLQVDLGNATGRRIPQTWILARLIEMAHAGLKR